MKQFTLGLDARRQRPVVALKNGKQYEFHHKRWNSCSEYADVGNIQYNRSCILYNG